MKKMMDEPAPRKNMPALPAVNTMAPAIAMPRTPDLSNTRPANRPIAAPRTAPGRVAKPLIVAEKPKTFCTYRGMRTLRPMRTA